MNRNENLERIKTEHFDVCVIGAGASGAGVALDAALRGLKVALIDKGDFSCETSSKSTKLIHGGVRYLEQAFKNLDFGQLKQVKHGLAERKYLLSNGSHLSRPLGIITPVFSLIEGLYYTIGLKMYGWFAKNDQLPAARWLSKKEMILGSPDITQKAHSAVMYFDGQLDDARFALALSQTAHQQGVATANYIALTDFKKDNSNKIIAATLKNTLNGETFEIKSKVFVNCTGPFADHLRLLANPAEQARIKPSKGVHIVIPKKYFNGEKALLIPKTNDGRLVFVIPFQSEIMIGTTDTKYDNLNEEPLLNNSEIDYLLETAERYLKAIPTKNEIKSGFGGIRPLISAKKKNPNDTKTLLRDHEVEIDEESGLVSLLGGKWTTYRLMAQDTCDAICEILGSSNVCKTKDFKLLGSQTIFQTKRPENFPLECFEHLINSYGDQTPKILSLIEQRPELLSKIHLDYPFIKAEVIYACEYEMAQTVRDFFARRTRWEILDWNACIVSIETVAELMEEALGWDSERKDLEVESYKGLLEKFKTVASS
ncbi:glycerol-3-phosphate dehydrogenase/oxidase [Lacihabitans soyangensis]|uniref:FAD-dependent oxidoreductase n=1 Tax=Lacihabitans soyangensis TaxID=869394 RepID=A0AAE3GZQ6_9BACT|nr:FAD-dependent oxidoreductase [Lacihabitans soyangensis]MCP9761630.1 FAD-dependent oxidoreductase [Lacihabitans soyangensis]